MWRDGCASDFYHVFYVFHVSCHCYCCCCCLFSIPFKNGYSCVIATLLFFFFISSISHIYLCLTLYGCDSFMWFPSIVTEHDTTINSTAELKNILNLFAFLFTICARTRFRHTKSTVWHTRICIMFISYLFISLLVYTWRLMCVFVFYRFHKNMRLSVPRVRVFIFLCTFYTIMESK